ncbi:TPA: carbamoyltransferase family protein [Aeromonas veronii]|nr:carbamoyltransferase C-terminal domain-containing protein [Aeromonas veronii]MCF5898265.1 hypothetical protein [Aeromonas veronii]UJP35903.1 hypothetical protein K3G24_07935 [Aeromonas veronii]HDX8349369.1 hypothetical protein [Aeromonas veronii]
MMKELVLGINYFGHDSAVSLVNMDGDVLYCLTEERFSNIKHDGAFPIMSINTIIDLIKQHALGDLRYIALNHDPELYVTDKLFNYIDSCCVREQSSLLKDNILAVLPEMRVCRQGMYPLNFLQELIIRLGIHSDVSQDLLRYIKWSLNRYLYTRQILNNIAAMFPACQVIPVAHHTCHAASAFFCSGYSESAIMTIDGYGEHDTVTLGLGCGHDISVISKSCWPNSIGLLYSMVTQYLGFDWFGDEYKVMGMAAYGERKYLPLFKKLGRVTEDGVFEFIPGDLMSRDEVPGAPGEQWYAFTPLLEQLLGGRRHHDDEFEQRHFDIAASLQAFVEDCGVYMAKYLKRIYPHVDKICIAGGVGLNGLMNSRILKEAGFSSIYIQPASSDDGTAIGAAFSVVASKSENPKFGRLQNMFLGVERSDEEIRLALDDKGLIYTREKNISAKIATLLSEGKVVARYEGRSEFGPRALGHRSIMASPLHQEMKDVINSRIKHRERFRPFAPACLAEDIKDYFYAEDDAEFMLIIPQVKADKQDIIPAVVHNDGTARVQAVHKSKNPGFYDIIEEFKKITGVPVVINTSFNVNGETIVESPQDAIECFLYTDIDYLAIGDYLVSKTDNLSARIKLSRSAFLELRKQRYCQQSWCRQLFWSSDTGSVSASESDLDAQERRMKWRRMASVLHRHLVAMPYPAFCIVGAGEIGIVFLNALRNRMQISCLVDKQAESMQGFSVPVKTLEQAIAEGERHFIIASEAFESELKARIKKLLPTEQIVMFGISDIITMMTSSVK